MSAFTCIAAKRRLKVFYPSGANLRVYGCVGRLHVAGMYLPAIEVHQVVRVGHHWLERGKLLILDPRAVVIDRDTSDVLYQPHGELERFDALSDMRWVTQWLQEHPEWPTILELPE